MISPFCEGDYGCPLLSNLAIIFKLSYLSQIFIKFKKISEFWIAFFLYDKILTLLLQIYQTTDHLTIIDCSSQKMHSAKLLDLLLCRQSSQASANQAQYEEAYPNKTTNTKTHKDDSLVTESKLTRHIFFTDSLYCYLPKNLLKVL